MFHLKIIKIEGVELLTRLSHLEYVNGQSYQKMLLLIMLLILHDFLTVVFTT